MRNVDGAKGEAVMEELNSAMMLDISLSLSVVLLRLLVEGGYEWEGLICSKSSSQ